MDNTIPQDSPLKQCKGPCGQFLPATTDFFHRDKSRKDGLCRQCKKCATAYQASFRANPGIQERNQLYQASYRQRPDYRERERKRTEAYLSRPGIREQRKIYFNDWYQAHYTEARQKQNIHSKERRKRPEVQQYDRAYRKMHSQLPDVQERSRAYVLARIARKKAIPGKLTTRQIRDKLKAQHYACYYCFTKFEKRKGRYVYHLEHTIPLSRTECNPRHDINYVVLSCPYCNLSKNNKLPHEWPEGGRLF